MEWLVLALVAGGGVVIGRRWQARQGLRELERSELEGVRRLADEDVTVLGEELQRLDREVEGRELDEAARMDYQTALDAYETAQRSVPQLRRAEEISKITDTLTTGRFALACVQARVAGLPLPERRVPCFFNPQHGPSTTNVMWTQPGRGTRQVPACAQDAARVADDEQPEVRRVRIGSRSVPYWEAGRAYQPYSEGYFAAAGTLTWVFAAATTQNQRWHDPGLGAGHGFDGGGGLDGGGGGDG